MTVQLGVMSSCQRASLTECRLSRDTLSAYIRLTGLYTVAVHGCCLTLFLEGNRLSNIQSDKSLKGVNQSQNVKGGNMVRIFKKAIRKCGKE